MPSSVQSPVSSPCDGPYNGLQIRRRLGVPSSVPSLFRPTHLGIKIVRKGIPTRRSKPSALFGPKGHSSPLLLGHAYCAYGRRLSYCWALVSSYCVRIRILPVTSTRKIRKTIGILHIWKSAGPHFTGCRLGPVCNQDSVTEFGIYFHFQPVLEVILISDTTLYLKTETKPHYRKRKSKLFGILRLGSTIYSPQNNHYTSNTKQHLDFLIVLR